MPGFKGDRGDPGFTGGPGYNGPRGDPGPHGPTVSEPYIYVFFAD